MTTRASAATVLVVNPGSSTLKLSVLGPDDSTRVETSITRAEPAADVAELERFVRESPGADAAGVRVVHGGREFHSPLLVDDSVAERLSRLDELAPLHNPPARRAIAALRAAMPQRPVVACFDTAFHANMPEAAAVYAIPWSWTSRWGLRRYGFHGLSHAWASRRAAELLGREARELRVVTCHLGAGASLAAVDGGVSVDTTMGFTPMDGLVMATRSGAVDPGVVLWAMRHHGLTAEETERVLDRESGLRGVSGLSGDMREVESHSMGGEERATRALDVYLHRLRAGIAAMAAALGRLDAVVFTGGVGENSALVRERCCSGLAILGLAAGLAEPGDGEDAVISPPGAGVAVLVVRAREDREVARLVRLTLDAGRGVAADHP